MRSPTFTSIWPSASFSSAKAICASLLPPTLTKATSEPNATMVPSMAWPRSSRRALTDASNIVAKSSSCSLTGPPSDLILRDAEGTKMGRVTHAVLVATLLTLPVLVERVSAHHGAGRYDMRTNVELVGKMTRLDFVNPHSYVYFDVMG